MEAPFSTPPFLSGIRIMGKDGYECFSKDTAMTIIGVLSFFSFPFFLPPSACDQGDTSRAFAIFPF